MAYDAPHRGSTAVFVRPFPSNGTAYQVTEAGRRNAFWSRDGQALNLVYSPGPGRFEAVAVTTQPNLAWSAAVPVPRGPLTAPLGSVRRNYDSAPGARIIGVADSNTGSASAEVSSGMQVVLQWFEELKRLVPTK